MRVVFLDTETTGLGPTDRLCQLSYTEYAVADDGQLILGESFTGLYKPPVPIAIEAMATHHITNKMVESQPAFMGTADHAYLTRLLHDPDTYMVAHNAKFDLDMLAREGITPANAICTLRLARKYDSAGQIPSHKLQYLRYFWDLPIGEAKAHDAAGDVLVLVEVFKFLSALFVNRDLSALTQISGEPTILPKFNFGKYKGSFIEDVVRSDRGYVEWVYGVESVKQNPDPDLLHTLRHYLKANTVQ